MINQAFSLVTLFRSTRFSIRLWHALGRGASPWLAILVLTALLVSPWIAEAQSDSTSPRNLTATVVDGEGVLLSWNAPAEDAESVTGYQILRRLPRQGEPRPTVYVADTGSTTTTYTDTDATAVGEQYNYRVKALRGDVASEMSNLGRVGIQVHDSTATPEPTPQPTLEPTTTPESTQTPVPESDSVSNGVSDKPPRNLTATVVEGEGVVLSWDAPAEDAESVTSYQILRRLPLQGEPRPTVYVADTGSTTTTYTDTDATAGGEQYNYRVKALRGDVASEMSNLGRVGIQVHDSTATPEPTPEPTTTPESKQTPVPESDGVSNGVSDLGDITYLVEPSSLIGSLNGDADAVVRYTFTLVQLKQVDMGLQDQKTNANLAVVDSEDVELAASRNNGTEDEALSVTLPAGAYVARVEAQESGASQYTFSYGVSVPDTQNLGQETVTPHPNQTANGKPVIEGDIEVEALLTVDTSGISDGNGLTNVQFDYQWIHSNDGIDNLIPGANSATYTLTRADAGNAFRVRVSFTDDDENMEELTSDVTSLLVLSAVQEDDLNVSEPSDGDLPRNTTTTGFVTIGGTVSGNVGEGGDFDWYGVELTEGAYYKFSLHGAAMENSQVALRGLADENGSYVTPTPAWAYRWSSIYWKPSRTGIFYLDVGPYQDNRNGAYTLSASLIEPAEDAIPADTTTAAQVGVGGSRLYAIQTAHDHDWIKVDFEEGVRYRVVLDVIKQTGRRGWADMFYPALVHIRDPDGDPIANTSNVYDVGTGLPDWWRQARAETYYRAAVEGTHYIVAGSSVNTTGIFRVWVVQTMDDDYSAGTSTTGAVTVDGSSVGGKIEVPGDKDWFKVSLTSGETYRVDVLGSYWNGGDLRWPELTGIYDSNGARFANTQNYNHGIGDSPRKYFIASQTGDHFIGVAGNPFGTYEVLVKKVDADLPADNTTTASLTVDGKVYGEIDRVNEEDWYQLILEADKAYTIKVGRHGRGGASDMRIKNLYDAEGNVISDLAGGHSKPRKYYDYQFYFEPAAAGTYYVSVDNSRAGGLGTPTGSYWVRVKEVEFDIPADTTSTTAATLNGRYTGVFEIKDDQDWYTFTGSAGKGYVVAGIPYIYVPPGRSYDWGIPIVGIYNSSGTKLPNTSDPWYNGGVYFELSSDGTYYVALKGSDLYPVTTYHLDLYETELDQPADLSTTATVSVGGTYSGWIQGYHGSSNPDRDWIKMTLVANEEYAIHMRGMPTGDGTLESPVIDGIFDSSGTRIADTKDGQKGQNAQVNFTPPADGDYYINAGWRSINYESPIFGSYTLEVIDVDGDGM